VVLLKFKAYSQVISSTKLYSRTQPSSLYTIQTRISMTNISIYVPIQFFKSQGVYPSVPSLDHYVAP
jgi:hypothetical protein